VTNECDKKEYCCATVAPVAKVTNCQAFTAITENNALCKATALLPKADTIKCWAKTEDAGTDPVCTVDTCCTPAGPAPDSSLFQAPEGTFEGNIQRSDVYQALLLKEKANFDMYMTRLANVGKPGANKGETDPFKEANGDANKVLFKDAAFYQSAINKPGMTVFSGPGVTSPAVAFAKTSPSKQKYPQSVIDTMAAAVSDSGAGTVAASKYAQFKRSTQLSAPNETKFRTTNHDILVSKFDEILQKAAALAVSLVVAATPEYTKITTPVNTSSDDAVQTKARADLKKALKNWSIPEDQLDTGDLYPTAYDYHHNSGGTARDANDFAYQLITQEGVNTWTLEKGLLDLFNYHVKFSGKSFDGKASADVTNILNRYTSDALKSILQTVGTLAFKVVDKQRTDKKVSTQNGAKDYVSIFTDYLSANLVPDFGKADVENLKWYLESPTAPTWQTYEALFRDMTTIKLANKFLGAEVINGEMAIEHLTSKTENGSQLWNPAKGMITPIKDPLTGAAAPPNTYDPAKALPTWEVDAFDQTEFSFENTITIANELDKLVDNDGKMTTIVFQNLAWLMENYSKKGDLDSGDWFWFQQQHSGYSRLNTEKKTREVLFGVFKTMEAWLATENHGHASDPTKLYADVANFPLTVLAPDAGAPEAKKELQNKAKTLVAELKKATPGTDLNDALTNFKDAYDAVDAGIVTDFGKLIQDGLKTAP